MKKLLPGDSIVYSQEGSFTGLKFEYIEHVDYDGSVKLFYSHEEYELFVKEYYGV